MAGVAAVMFVLHMLSSDQPFLPRDLFRDRNLMLGLIFTAVTGLLMIVTATLLPPFLQQLKGYPVFTTGIVMAPRGIGTMISMFLVSRLIGRVDARWLIAIGLGLCAHVALRHDPVHARRQRRRGSSGTASCRASGSGWCSRRSPRSPSPPSRCASAPRARR